MKQQRRVVFVLSSPLSGSTWVGYVLGSHSQSAFLGEFARAWHPELSVPCTLCAAKGLDGCEVLHGAERVPPEQAFAWAFVRTQKPVLVDNSKMLEWTERFLGGKEYDIRLVHVVKDPRNWLASMQRRNLGDRAGLLRMWHDANAEIRAFAQRAGCPTMTVFYDELAANPVSGYRRLFAFCDLPFEASALEYWNVPHHGFAANGASSAMLADGRLGPPPSHFATGDDAFYAARTRRLFVDDRWKRDLGEADAAAVASDPLIAALLARFGRRLTAAGLASTSPLAGVKRLVQQVWQRA